MERTAGYKFGSLTITRATDGWTISGGTKNDPFISLSGTRYASYASMVRAIDLIRG